MPVSMAERTHAPAAREERCVPWARDGSGCDDYLIDATGATRIHGFPQELVEL